MPKSSKQRERPAGIFESAYDGLIEPPVCTDVWAPDSESQEEAQEHADAFNESPHAAYAGRD